MGEVKVKVELENYDDRAVASRGLLSEDRVRLQRVDVVVDSGAVMLVLPQDLVEALGHIATFSVPTWSRTRARALGEPRAIRYTIGTSWLLHAETGVSLFPGATLFSLSIPTPKPELGHPPVTLLFTVQEEVGRIAGPLDGGTRPAGPYLPENDDQWQRTLRVLKRSWYASVFSLSG